MATSMTKKQIRMSQEDYDQVVEDGAIFSYGKFSQIGRVALRLLSLFAHCLKKGWPVFAYDPEREAVFDLQISGEKPELVPTRLSLSSQAITVRRASRKGKED